MPAKQTALDAVAEQLRTIVAEQDRLKAEVVDRANDNARAIAANVKAWWVEAEELVTQAEAPLRDAWRGQREKTGKRFGQKAAAREVEAAQQQLADTIPATGHPRDYLLLQDWHHQARRPSGHQQTIETGEQRWQKADPDALVHSAESMAIELEARHKHTAQALALASRRIETQQTKLNQIPQAAAVAQQRLSALTAESSIREAQPQTHRQVEEARRQTIRQRQADKLAEQQRWRHSPDHDHTTNIDGPDPGAQPLTRNGQTGGLFGKQLLRSRSRQTYSWRVPYSTARIPSQPWLDQMQQSPRSRP